MGPDMLLVYSSPSSLSSLPPFPPFLPGVLASTNLLCVGVIWRVSAVDVGE